MQNQIDQIVYVKVGVCTVCHSVCILWAEYLCVIPHYANFRIIAVILGVQNFCIFMAYKCFCHVLQPNCFYSICNYVCLTVGDVIKSIAYSYLPLFICIICKYLRAAREISFVLIVLPS